MRKAIVSDKAPRPRGPYSPAIIASGPTVYVSAQGWSRRRNCEEADHRGRLCLLHDQFAYPPRHHQPSPSPRPTDV